MYLSVLKTLYIFLDVTMTGYTRYMHEARAASVLLSYKSFGEFVHCMLSIVSCCVLL